MGFRKLLGHGSGGLNEEDHGVGAGVRGVQESQESDVEWHLVQPVECCTIAAVSLVFLWLGLNGLGVKGTACCVLSCCRALVTWPVGPPAP